MNRNTMKKAAAFVLALACTATLAACGSTASAAASAVDYNAMSLEELTAAAGSVNAGTSRQTASSSARRRFFIFFSFKVFGS